LRWAADEARLRGATLEAVLAWQMPFVGDIPLPPMADLERAAMATLEKVLADEGCTDDTLTTVVSIVSEGASAPVLLDAAIDADLLVLGSRGRGAFRGMLLGSVSQHCVTHATCPVVVVRTNDAPSDAPLTKS
jgi:nucleotide-binding universal stress UspA family protein